MKKLTSYPMLLGILISFLIAGAIFVITIWAPWIWDALGRQKRLAQAIYFTAFFFAVFIYISWPWRRRGTLAFWASISIFFLLHVLGVFFYSTRVGPILEWQWMIVLPVEAYAAAFFVGLLTWRFGRARRGKHLPLAAHQGSNRRQEEEE